jgi:hypothetical protein
LMSTSSDVCNRFATPKNPTKASERSISCNHCISSKYKTNVCETITVKFESKRLQTSEEVDINNYQPEKRYFHLGNCQIYLKKNKIRHRFNRLGTITASLDDRNGFIILNKHTKVKKK